MQSEQEQCCGVASNFHCAPSQAILPRTSLRHHRTSIYKCWILSLSPRLSSVRSADRQMYGNLSFLNKIHTMFQLQKEIKQQSYSPVSYRKQLQTF